MAAVALLAAGVLAAPAPSAQAATPSRLLAHVAGTDLFELLNPNGTGIVTIPNSTGSLGGAASLSYDGLRIAFSAGGRITVMNINGTGRKAITTPGSGEVDTYPAWSHNGKHIVFFRTHEFVSDSSAGLETVVPDGTGLQHLTVNGTTGAAGAAYSPDDLHIVYSWYGGNTCDDTSMRSRFFSHLSTIGADGAGDAPVPVDPPGQYWEERNPQWAGNQLLFERAGGWVIDPSTFFCDGGTTNGDIYTYATAFSGSTLTDVTNTPAADDQAPALSPDRSQFAVNAGSGYLTYTISNGASVSHPLPASNSIRAWGGAVATAPRVVAKSPASGATGVSLGTSTARLSVQAKFDQNVTGVSGSSFTVRQGSALSPVPGAVVYQPSTLTATFTPSAPLAADTSYTVGLSSAIKGAFGGIPLVATSWRFLTGPRPVVTSRSPVSAAVGVARAANVTAAFSEAVTGLPTTAAATSNFTIKQTSSGTAFASVVSYNATSHTATLNPTGTLLANTKYTVTITSGVKDIAGNPLLPVTWSFTTGSA